MKSISLLLILSMFTINSLNAQQVFQKTFGGVGTDFAYYMQQTSDGGYVSIGQTENFGAGGLDIYLIKMDSAGEVLWTKTYGGSGDEFGYYVQETSDGGYIIAGETSSFGLDSSDVYLIKTNSSGDVMWTKTYGGSKIDVGSCVQQTYDGGYVIIGHTESYGEGSADSYLIRTDSVGDTLFTKTYGGIGWDGSYIVQITNDFGYILSGETYGFGSGPSDVYLIKVDENGVTEWTKTFGGNGYEGAWGVQQTTDNGYIVAGWANSFGAGNYDVYLIRTDSNGDTIWTKTYGGTGLDVGIQVQQTSDNGFIVAGYTYSFGAGGGDVYLIKTNANGDISWSQAYGDSVDDAAYAVQQSSDGNFIIVGISFSIGAGSSDVYLIRTDSIGNAGGCLQSSAATIESNPQTLVGTTATVRGSGGSVNSTSTIISNTTTIDSSLCIVTAIHEQEVPKPEVSLYPNPTAGFFLLDTDLVDIDKIMIRNYLGQVVKTYSLPNQTMDLSDQPAGIYFVSFIVKAELITRKIIKR